MNDLWHWLASHNWQRWLAPALIGVISAVLSIALSIAVLVRLPTDHFGSRSAPGNEPAPGVLSWLGRNVAGLVLVVVGLLLSLPGIPGQGLLLMFVGIVVMDLPFTRRAEVWALRRPWLRKSIDRIRRRYGKEPFVLDPEPGEPK